MTIRNRLKMVGVVPILLLILLSGYFFTTSYVNYEKAKALKTMLKNNVYLNNSLVALGKERGLTGLYLGSDGKEFGTQLKKQRAATDRTLDSLSQNLIYKNITMLPFLLNTLGEEDYIEDAKYIALLNKLKHLPAIRKTVDKNKESFRKIFSYRYTQKLTDSLLDNIADISHFALNTEITALSNSLLQLSVAKENAGLERDFVAYFMLKKASMTFEDMTLWDQYRTKANSFDIKQISDSTLRAQVQGLLSSDKSKALMQELGATSSAIQTDVDNGDYAEDPLEWFSLQTKKIALLSKVERAVASNLWEKSDAFLKSQLLLFGIASFIFLLSLILAYMGFHTTRDISRNIAELEDLLNKGVNEIKNNDAYLTSDTAHIENIELDTHKGTKDAYRFLDTLIETAKEDKKIALQANEAKSLFLANMSHEIRTPLNGIVGFTEILKGTKLSKEQEEFVSIIHKSSDNLLNIINNILDLSKIESNKIEIENIVFDAAAEFESAIETYAVAAAEKDIELNFYMDPSISKKLKGDPTKLKEILINLLSNAIKFTPKDGEINLQIRPLEGNDGNLLTFSIEDNGIGMSKGQQSRIFEAFSQADISVTRKFGGTGLGLTISKQFVELMGGKLQVESQKNVGSKFFFTIPLEGISSADASYAGLFETLTLGKYVSPTPSTLDTYLSDYLAYFKPHIETFESIDEVRLLVHDQVCKSFWFDLDNTPANMLETITHLPRSKVTVLANVTNRALIEELGIPQENVLYKPLTLTKLKSTLTRIAEIVPEKIEENSTGFSTQFEAKVLVAEDNNINQKLIQRILESHGMEVDLANNGQEALDARENENYDLIFMDIQMPVMDGIEATHAILEYEKTNALAHTPIVALTANALKGDRERFIAEGMDEYITKPIGREELQHILNKFIAEKAVEASETTDEPEIIEEIEKIEEVEETAVTSEEKIDLVDFEDLSLEIQEELPEAAVEEAEESIKTEKILVAKKYLIERNILKKVLENLDLDYDILDDTAQLPDMLSQGKYDILIADDSLITDQIRSQYTALSIVTEPQTKEALKMFIDTQRGV